MTLAAGDPVGLPFLGVGMTYAGTDPAGQDRACGEQQDDQGLETFPYRQCGVEIDRPQQGHQQAASS